MLTADWPLDDPEALADTIEMGAMLSRYLDRWGARGYDEARAVAVAAGRASGYVAVPDDDCECDGDAR